MIIILCFACFVTVYRKKCDKLTKKIIADSITTADYSIKVTGFPSTGVDEQELKDFFKQYGKPIEAPVIRNFHGTLFQFKYASELTEKISREKFANPENKKSIMYWCCCYSK